MAWTKRVNCAVVQAPAHVALDSTNLISYVWHAPAATGGWRRWEPDSGATWTQSLSLRTFSLEPDRFLKARTLSVG